MCSSDLQQRCRGIVESSRGRGAIELGREVGFRDQGGSNVGMCKSLPRFRSRNGGETLCAAIIHYKAISPITVVVLGCVDSLP